MIERNKNLFTGVDICLGYFATVPSHYSCIFFPVWCRHQSKWFLHKWNPITRCNGEYGVSFCCSNTSRLSIGKILEIFLSFCYIYIYIISNIMYCCNNVIQMFTVKRDQESIEVSWIRNLNGCVRYLNLSSVSFHYHKLRDIFFFFFFF